MSGPIFYFNISYFSSRFDSKCFGYKALRPKTLNCLNLLALKHKRQRMRLKNPCTIACQKQTQHCAEKSHATFFLIVAGDSRYQKPGTRLAFQRGRSLPFDGDTIGIPAETVFAIRWGHDWPMPGDRFTGPPGTNRGVFLSPTEWFGKATWQ